MDELTKKLRKFWFYKKMNYSLLRSKTFWTLILMFVGDFIAVYGNLLSTEQIGLVNLVLTSVASYFHLQTGKSTLGSN